MVGRDVQQLEVVLLGLDLRTLEDLEAVRVEDLAHVAHERHDRVEVTDRHRPPRRAHVERLVRQARIVVRTGQGGLARLDGGLQLAANLVGQLPERGTLRGRDRSELLEQLRQAPRPAEQLVAQLAQRVGVGDRCDACRSVGAEALEVGSEIGHAALTSSGKTNDPAPDSGRGRGVTGVGGAPVRW